LAVASVTVLAGLKMQDSNAGRRGLVPCRPGRGQEALSSGRSRR
jgi:hypothetical protein